MPAMKFVDLFCGIGGFRQALSDLGHKCVFSCDLDKDSRATYEANYGEKPSGDILQIETSIIPEHNILCAGFPCQSFSISGKQNGFEDARGTLFHEIIRIAGYHQPEILLLENVKNYKSHAGGKTLSKTIHLLNEIGYSVYYEVLNSSRYGVAQKESGFILFVFRKDLNHAGFNFPAPLDKTIYLQDCLLPKGDSRLENLFIQRSDLKMSNCLPGKLENKPLRIGTIGKGGQGERIYSPKGHAITLSAFGGGVGAKTGLYLVGDRIRRLHPEECRRLMGFPDSFSLHPKQNVSFKQFGNSVVVPVIRSIFESVEEHLSPGKLKAA